MPSGVKATTDGRSFRPSASGIKGGNAVASSTYATRLFVVPRARPMMRGNLISLTQRLTEVVDHGAQVRAGGQRLLEIGQDGRPASRARRVPRGGQRADQSGLFLGLARDQVLALLGQRAPASVIEPAGLGLGQRFLDLEHLRQQLGRSLRLVGGAFLRLSALLQANEVVNAGDGVAQGPVRGVESRRGRKRLRLLRGRRARVEVRVIAPRQLVEPSL